ncbi:hypothetical protein MCOR30_000917 [Pyricularia oryzae]|nr:hypothetical protein MCOR30_000917 [Pyricularia oryzae]
MTEPPYPYNALDAAKLQEAADSSLLSYGPSFHNEIIARAEGVFIYTVAGRRILDWTSGQMSCLIGHGNPEVVSVIHQHATSLDHLFSGMLSPPVINLAAELKKLLPPGLERSMFLSTGGESNEAAIRMAKCVTGRWEIVGLSASWHGMTGGAAGAQYHSGRRGIGPMIPGNLMLPAPNAYRSIFRHADGTYDWETELDHGWAMVDAASSGSLAAVILEPILSSAGMHALPDGYLAAMKAHCERRGMLLILDEAQTAIGRAGDMFAFQHPSNGGVVPDVLPLSAVVTSDAIAARARGEGFLFFTTHVNDPLPAAVGLKVLQIVQRDGLVQRSRRLGERLHAGLGRLQERYACIGDVRGRGLMAGVEIVSDRATKAPGMELADRLGKRMMELGFSANLATLASFGGAFRIAPPITISEEELDLGLGFMEEALRSTEGSMPTGR